MLDDVYKVGTTKPRNSEFIMSIKIHNKDYCKKKIEEEVFGSIGIVHRNDVGANYYQTEKIQDLIVLVCKVAEQDRKKHKDEREKNIEHPQKRQKTTHKEATNKVSIEFTMSEPAIFNPGKVTVKTAGTKRTIYPQQKN